MIKLHQVQKSFLQNNRRKLVLENISFELPAGSFTTLFGPNGCGKSTLVNIISGLDRPDSGEILGLDAIRGKTAYVFQDYRRSLLPWATAKENILFPLKLRGVAKEEQQKLFQEALELAKINLDWNQRVLSLSGGQAQAVAILRALIIKPKFLILDEPFAALDFERTLFLREMISEVCHKLNLTVLFICHDLEEAVILGDQVLFLSRVPTVVLQRLEVNYPSPRANNFSTTNEFLQLKVKALRYFEECCQYSQVSGQK